MKKTGPGKEGFKESCLQDRKNTRKCSMSAASEKATWSSQDLDHEVHGRRREARPNSGTHNGPEACARVQITVLLFGPAEPGHRTGDVRRGAHEG